AVKLEEKQEEINSQNEELMSQRDELENNNHMLVEQKQQILEQHEELEKHRNQLESLVEERTHELLLAKEKAEESDRLKSSFLANLSHEIRTPLNAILGFSSLLGEKDITDEERAEYNRIVQGSSGTLLELINDILDISKIEAGQLELDLHEVSLDALLSDQVVVFDMLLKRDDIGLNKDMAFKLSIDNDIRDITIVTDSVRLNQVLSNLLNNAVKFTREGYIELGCRKLPDAEMLEFYVRDTGIGIREENQQMVFERFRKVEEDKERLHRGTGLGLAISNQLVNLMGGSMHLTSKVGEGSVFYFTIPLIRSNASLIQVSSRQKEFNGIDLSGVKIVVAEDDAANFNYIERLLRKTKAIVYHAETGRQVLDILNREKDIRLILMDIKMPEMDGIEALHALRKLNFTMPVIAQTAYALADEVVKLKREGFDEYISKPIQQDLLFAILASYFKQS
ncbi:MAG: response regulator, partial [Bacteroidales bacterium]|nr:response regulator [Bacteroidales bacterium]